MSYPKIIQGGMGAGVSGWRLARAVSMEGQLGVVSGTALTTLIARVLQSGDPGGHLTRAAAAFPNQALVQRVFSRYFVPGGIAPGATYKRHPMFTLTPDSELLELTVFGAFSEVWLAKEGHGGIVGINLLEKIVLPNLPSLYGAMLAEVDYVIMGAGIPLEIPGSLDALAEHRVCSLKVPVHGAPKGSEFKMTFDPATILPEPSSPLKRPIFLAIIASNVLATALLKRANGRIDGFVVEAPTAGGHNAPPRGPLSLNDRGEPLYGPKDDVNLEELGKHGLPFWLAGSCGSPDRLREALESGAAGIQAGTIFALCEESGFTPEIKGKLRQGVADGSLEVFTDPKASPTGFPFKVAGVKGTLAMEETYEERPRRCDLGYLRTGFMKEDGRVDFRCPAEPVDQYLKKGGDLEETEGRKCLCNGLTGVVGLPQHQPGGYTEGSLITIGDDVKRMACYFEDAKGTMTAKQVIRALLQGATTPA